LKRDIPRRDAGAGIPSLFRRRIGKLNRALGAPVQACLAEHAPVTPDRLSALEPDIPDGAYLRADAASGAGIANREFLTVTLETIEVRRLVPEGTYPAEGLEIVLFAAGIERGRHSPDFRRELAHPGGHDGFGIEVEKGDVIIRMSR